LVQLLPALLLALFDLTVVVVAVGLLIFFLPLYLLQQHSPLLFLESYFFQQLLLLNLVPLVLLSLPAFLL
jgi:hypothetical protein